MHLLKALTDERTLWLLSVCSVLYHHGLSPGAPGEIGDMERSPRKIARRQAGCQALMTQLGVGELIDADRARVMSPHVFLAPDVRVAGIDIGVHRCDQTARVSKLTRQGTASLR